MPIEERDLKRWLNKIWYEIVRDVLFLTFAPLFRVRGFGVKNIPRKGPVIFLSNHQSFLDPIFCQVPVWRHMHYMARDSLFKHKVFGPLLKSIYAIPIRRGSGDLAAMRKIIAALKQNAAVCLFPEGTRTKDGKIADIQPGFALLARKTGAMVVPVVIDGAFECWPRDRKFPSLGKVRVSYGEAIDAEQIACIGDKKFAAQITKTLRQMQTELRKRFGKSVYDYNDTSMGD